MPILYFIIAALGIGYAYKKGKEKFLNNSFKQLKGIYLVHCKKYRKYNSVNFL